MKAAWICLLGIALSTVACAPQSFVLPHDHEHAHQQPAPASARQAGRPTHLVAPEQVSDATARDVGNRLLRELDRDGAATPE